MTSAVYQRSAEVLSEKAGEYTTDKDRLENFKKSGAWQGISPEKALRGMWSKHLVSITDMIDALDDGVPINFDKWDEKLIDSINYHILLRGLLVDRSQVEGK